MAEDSISTVRDNAGYDWKTSVTSVLGPEHWVPNTKTLTLKLVMYHIPNSNHSTNIHPSVQQTASEQ